MIEHDSFLTDSDRYISKTINISVDLFDWYPSDQNGFSKIRIYSALIEIKPGSVGMCPYTHLVLDIKEIKRIMKTCSYEEIIFSLFNNIDFEYDFQQNVNVPNEENIFLKEYSASMGKIKYLIVAHFVVPDLCLHLF